MWLIHLVYIPSLLVLFFLLAIIYENRKSSLHTKTLFRMFVFIFLWMFASYLGDLGSQQEIVRNYVMLANMAGAFVPGFIYVFLSLFDKEFKISVKGQLLLLIYSALYASLLYIDYQNDVLTGYNPAQVEFINKNFTIIVYTPTFFGLSLLGLWNLYKSLKKGMAKKGAKIAGLAIITAVLINLPFNLMIDLLDLDGKFFLISIFTVAAVCAVFNFSLMNRKIFIFRRHTLKSVNYNISLIIFTMLYTLLILMVLRLLSVI